MTVKKRFIAGARCPRCGEMDSLTLYTQNEQRFRECVSCDFHEVMHFAPQTQELPTRVNTSAEEKAAQVQPVRLILDPLKKP
jgi:uncharacterized protein